MTILPLAFYQRPTITVAREMLGKILMRRIGDRVLSGRIVEVEAYHEIGDESSHSHRGRRVPNDIMFRAGGHLYVYFTYGMHFCMNVVTEGEGVGAAVLIRAIEPLEGLEVMRRHRGGDKSDRDLANGPAKLCQALAIGREANGLLLDGAEVGIADAPGIAGDDILVSTRVGISRSRDLPWRFYLASAWLSPGRPSTGF